MTEPEIARRCSVCGATIRKRSMFCPQCGQKVADETAVPEVSVKTSKKKPKAAKTKPESRDTQIELSDPTNFAAPATVPLKPIAPPVESPPVEPPVVAAPTVELSKYAEAAPTQALNTIQATAVYDGSTQRQANTEPLGKVSALKKVSTVIDQAAYDPSVRFILIAGVLFVVFLLLLVFSKIIG
jgi:hypothetical protein